MTIEQSVDSPSDETSANFDETLDRIFRKDPTNNSFEYLNIVEKYGQIMEDQKALDAEISRRFEWILGNADQRNKLIEMKCCIEEVLHDDDLLRECNTSAVFVSHVNDLTESLLGIIRIINQSKMKMK